MIIPNTAGKHQRLTVDQMPLSYGAQYDLFGTKSIINVMA